jgi:replicative DNA helicase
MENPQSNLREKVKGVAFSESIEIRDPYTKLPTKKEIKPYMVDNLRQYLEREQILFSSFDEELYTQLISYVVVRTTQSGRPVFEAGGSAVDHAHDALMLALLAITQNFGEFSKIKSATNTTTFSNTFFMPKQKNEEDSDSEKESGYGKHFLDTNRTQGLKAGRSRKSGSRQNTRKMF